MRDLRAIAAGEVELVFRRWARARVTEGAEIRTAVGLVAIEAVEVLEMAALTEDDAARAGRPSLEALREELASRTGTLFRIAVRYAGEDPRVALREEAALDEAAIAELDRRLARFDAASPQGPWTETVLRLIAERPETRAAELAEAGGFEVKWFKTKVRKLKELGLTESLTVGYRLSARGQAYRAGG